MAKFDNNKYLDKFNAFVATNRKIVIEKVLKAKGLPTTIKANKRIYAWAKRENDKIRDWLVVTEDMNKSDIKKRSMKSWGQFISNWYKRSALADRNFKPMTYHEERAYHERQRSRIDEGPVSIGKILKKTGVIK